jgi:alpha-L-fucosidase
MTPKYEETWDSLKKHRQPEWLDDAKWGIYFHWGPYSVPAFGNEWYPHNMYFNWAGYHEEHFGPLEEGHGYKELIPMFTAENFDPDYWAALFKEAGAQFAGPVAEHHDGFSMWASKVNPWNAMDMGPHRDIVGEMAKAIRNQGMKFITTFHHANNWYYYFHEPVLDTSDPEYASLYGKPHEATQGIGYSSTREDRPDLAFNEQWFAKLKEVIDNYRPDLIWFDFCLSRIMDKFKRKFLAYYYNAAEEWGTEVEVLYKDFNLPPGVGILDYERGRSSAMTHYKWITDTSMGRKSWSYIDNEEYLPIDSLVQSFVDRIAKNGYLLLNFGPKANGDIPQEVQDRFRAFGAWIKVNEEAIFGSTPWVVAEEGPIKLMKDGGFNEDQDYTNPYTSEDIRFTTKGNALYAIAFGWPDQELTIKTLTAPPKYRKAEQGPKEWYIIEESDIASITLLGHDEPLEWRLTNQGLKIAVPAEKPCDHAYVFKIAWT